MRHKRRIAQLSWRRPGRAFRLAVAKDANSHELPVHVALLDPPEVASVWIALEDHEAVSAGRGDRLDDGSGSDRCAGRQGTRQRGIRPRATIAGDELRRMG